MTGLTAAAKNAMLDSMAITKASLHTADPADNGANEVTGGAYAQKNISFAAAAAGAIDSSVNPVFDVPAGVTVTHAGFWAGATFKFSIALSAAETFAALGTYTLNDADLDLNK